MVHKAYVISPKDIGSSSIECDDCSMKYGVADYKTLYLSKKICYFFLPSSEEEAAEHSFTFDVILCHQCLFKYLKKTTSQTDTPLTVLIIEEGRGYHITVDPSDVDSSADEWMDNFDDWFSDDDDDDDDDGYEFLGPSKY